MPNLSKKAAAALGLVGIDLGRLGSARHVRRFFRDRRQFLAQGGTIDVLKPVLFDYDDQSGVASGHYFHQDLLVAQFVHADDPRDHLDVASRIDGFVAHVAAFRAIDVIDVRPLATDEHPNIRFIQADLMQPQEAMRQRYPSVSCLHALEHFGLGRYTDPVAVDGHLLGFEAILNLVAPGGMLYVSFPIGRRRIEFNSQRVFDPDDLMTWVAGRAALIRFDFVDDDGRLHQRQQPSGARHLHYGCGIYSLRVGAAAAAPRA